MPCWKFHMQVVLVYLQPFRRNLPFKCVSQLKIAKNLLKTPILGVQGHSRSSMLTFIRSSSPVLFIISSMSVPICNHFHVGWANSGRITLYKGVPCFDFSFGGPPLPSGMKFCCKILEDLCCHVVKTQGFYLAWFWNSTGLCRTDRRTERQTKLPYLLRAISSYASSRA